MMMFVPTAFQNLKAAILIFLLLVLFVVSVIKRGYIYIHRSIFLWTSFFITIGFFFTFYGFVRNNPGALNVSTVYVIWPAVYTLLITGICSEQRIEGLMRVMVISTIFIGLYSFLFVFHFSGFLPEYFYIAIYDNDKTGISFSDGVVEISIPSMASLLFLVPFLIAVLLTWPKSIEFPVSRHWLWFALVIGLVIVILSGRRALQLVVVFSPLIVLFHNFFSRRYLQKVDRLLVFKFLVGIFIIITGVFILLQVVYDYSLNNAFDIFVAGFDFSHDTSASARSEQFFALLNGWSENVLFGSGFGATALGSLRSDTQAWAYELSYLALLFHTGLFGFLAYFSGVFWIYFMGIRMIRSGDKVGLYMLPVLVGTTSFLIGNASNPYLSKYDFLWVIFLPVALINFWLLSVRIKNSDYK